MGEGGGGKAECITSQVTSLGLVMRTCRLELELEQSLHVASNELEAYPPRAMSRSIGEFVVDEHRDGRPTSDCTLA
eukprot:scaffold219482_cov35-Tisochrysis_lutea.AAC.1